MKSQIHHEYVSIGNQSATHRIILLHGWGADAYDLLPVANQIIQDSVLEFEIISLMAPNTNKENNLRQWYGLFPAKWDEAKKEVQKLKLTLREFGKSRIPFKNTILLGFSQGAAMSIASGIDFDFGLIVACSGYLHPDWKPPKRVPRVLLSHGINDQIVPNLRSREIYQKLESVLDSQCEIIEFEGNHEIDIAVIEAVISQIKLIF